MESKEYTYNELMQMQEQAIQRVRDMQERARITLEEHEMPAMKKESFAEKGMEQRGNLKENDSRGIPQSQTGNGQQTGHGAKNFSPERGLFGDIFKMDKDKALVLPILMLLGKDAADSVLLIALMYIMA